MEVIFALFIALSPTDAHVEQAEPEGFFETLAECQAAAQAIRQDGSGYWAWCE